MTDNDRPRDEQDDMGSRRHSSGGAWSHDRERRYHRTNWALAALIAAILVAIIATLATT